MVVLSPPYICTLYGVLELGLELRVFVEVEAAVPTVSYGSQDTADAGGDGDHDDLYVGHVEAIVG